MVEYLVNKSLQLSLWRFSRLFSDVTFHRDAAKRPSWKKISCSWHAKHKVCNKNWPPRHKFPTSRVKLEGSIRVLHLLKPRPHIEQSIVGDDEWSVFAAPWLKDLFLLKGREPTNGSAPSGRSLGQRGSYHDDDDKYTESDCDWPERLLTNHGDNLDNLLPPPGLMGNDVSFLFLIFLTLFILFFYFQLGPLIGCFLFFFCAFICFLFEYFNPAYMFDLCFVMSSHHHHYYYHNYKSYMCH